MATGVPIQPRDDLGHFMLPQAPEEAGYYVYGNVGGVAGTGHLAQYAHPIYSPSSFGLNSSGKPSTIANLASRTLVWLTDASSTTARI